VTGVIEVVALVLGVAAVVYLVVALLLPERF
jgi:K+-transporting ATPase KdpF subunit